MKKILLAEDDKINRGLYEQLISQSFPDYKLEIFPDGNSLVGRLEKDVTDVILILTDNTMPPGPKGNEIIQKYAKTPKFDKIPFILCYADVDTIGYEAIKNGAFSFIRKPHDIKQYIDLLKSAIDKYK